MIRFLGVKLPGTNSLSNVMPVRGDFMILDTIEEVGGGPLR